MRFVLIGDQRFYPLTEVAEELRVSRQSLWLWRKSGKIPMGQRGRRQVLFTEAEVSTIRDYANRLEPIELGGIRQMRLFSGRVAKENP
jgi:DNA-binding transcriptional MerR regulator